MITRRASKVNLCAFVKYVLHHLQEVSKVSSACARWKTQQGTFGGAVAANRRMGVREIK